MKRPRVAVVEDNADNRLLLGAMLEEIYDVAAYPTGPEALEALRTERPDVLILDVSLPGMDGMEVLRRLREDSSLNGLPVIALTAHAMQGDRERFLQAGFDEYLSKPIVDEQDLFSAIARSLQPSDRSR